MLLWAHFCPPGGSVSNGCRGVAMKCLACGAEMRLIDVRIEATTPFAIERRIFQCSSCRQTAQRLGFDRSGLPDRTAPTVKTCAPALSLQSHRSTARGAPGHAREVLISREVAVTPKKPIDWRAVVGKVSITHKEQASQARAAAWARTMEKLRSRQMALKAQAVPIRTTGREFDRVWYGHCLEEAPNPAAPGSELVQDGGAT